MINGQNDQLFPSLIRVSKWYEHQLIITTTYVKALAKHFKIKAVDISTIQMSTHLQLEATGMQRPNEQVPHRIVFELKNYEGIIPVSEVKQDRRPDLKILSESSETKIEEGEFEFDEKLTDDDLDLLSVSNVDIDVDTDKKRDPNSPMSVSTLAQFYEAKIDLMGKISKSIMLKAQCSKLELDWDSNIEGTIKTQLHLNYHMKDGKKVEKISLRLSEVSEGETGPTTYGFIREEIQEEEKPKSHLSLVK